MEFYVQTHVFETDCLFWRIILAAQQIKQPRRIFRLRLVCRELRNKFDALLREEKGGVVLTAAIQWCMKRAIWLYHQECALAYTGRLHWHLLKVAAQGLSASDLCDELIRVAIWLEERNTAPSLQQLLVTAAAKVMCDDAQRDILTELACSNFQWNFDAVKMFTAHSEVDVCNLVRKVAEVIATSVNRCNRVWLAERAAQAAQMMVHTVVSYLDPESPTRSIITWAGQQYLLIEEKSLPRRCIPKHLKILCNRWLQVTASVNSPLLSARCKEQDLCYRLYKVRSFKCTCPDCGNWRL